MQKIVPYDLSIIIDKSKLVKSLSGIDENKTFINPKHIKDSLEEFFTKSSDGKSISLTKKGRKFIGMENLVESNNKEGRDYLFFNLSVSSSKAKELGETKIVNEQGHILYKVNKGEVVLNNFFCYIELKCIDQGDKYLLNGKVFILSRGIETIRYELEQLLQTVCYNKKAIVKIQDSLTPKDIKNFKNNIKEIQVTGQFKGNNDFVNLDTYSNDELKKLKMGFFIKGQKDIVQTLKNKTISNIFLKGKYETKATIKVGKSQRTAELDIEELTLLMKSDIIDSNEQYTFNEFKNKCLEYNFGIGKTINTIK